MRSNPALRSLARTRRIFRKRHPPVGAQPGTLVIDRQAAPSVVRVLTYTADEIREDRVDDLATLRAHERAPGVSWVDVQGLGDEAMLRAVGEIFRIHPLALEDVVNVPQRPKAEEYEHQTFIVTRAPRPDAREHFDTEQIGIFVGANYVLTFQERHGDHFDTVRHRIRQGGPIFRTSGPAYLAYALLDASIDAYYPELERLGDRLETLEEMIITRPRTTQLREMHRMRHELLAMRRAIWPLRDAVHSLLREEVPFVTDAVRVQLRDCADHCVQIIDVVETYRELIAGLMDVYLTHVGQRQNEIMKVLTVMASIFIPLTFIAGVYGMNFEHMPELHRRWAYPTVLLLMAALAGGMLWVFRRKGWLGTPPDERDAGPR